MSAKISPSLTAPRADRRHYGNADGENDAEEGGVFDEGRAAVVLMEVAEERYDVAHDLKFHVALLHTQTAALQLSSGRPQRTTFGCSVMIQVSS